MCSDQSWWFSVLWGENGPYVNVNCIDLHQVDEEGRKSTENPVYFFQNQRPSVDQTLGISALSYLLDWTE